MLKRPTSVTVIGWFLVISGLLSLVFMVPTMLGFGFRGAETTELMQKAMERTLLPVPLQHALSIIGLLVSVVAGVGVLKGMNWARWLYVGWTASMLAVMLVTSPFRTMMIPGAAVLAVVATFLFRPKATAYFRKQSSPDA